MFSNESRPEFAFCLQYNFRPVDDNSGFPSRNAFQCLMPADNEHYLCSSTLYEWLKTLRHKDRFPGSLAPQKDEAQGVGRRSEHDDLSLVIL